jgi:hypothetical protein
MASALESQASAMLLFRREGSGFRFKGKLTEGKGASKLRAGGGRKPLHPNNAMNIVIYHWPPIRAL